MSIHDTGRELHDRATRGQTLCEREKKALDAWYARLDEAEGRLLTLPRAPDNLDELRKLVDDALAQLVRAAQRVRELAAENDALRRHNEKLARR